MIIASILIKNKFLLINCCELNGDTLCRAIMWK